MELAALYAGRAKKSGVRRDGRYFRRNTHGQLSGVRRPARHLMSLAPPDNEAARLAALQRYNVLDTAPEESFDRITRLARSVLETPIALVSLVDKDRQWFKSRQGLAATETPRDISFCTHTVQSEEPMVIRDALRDPRFSDNPLVHEEPHIRFYIGVPLTTPDGYNIGTLCAIDRRPREVSAEQIEVLKDLGRLVVDELELRQMAATDSLTGAMTRRSFECEVAREVDRAMRHNRPLSFLFLDVDHFKVVNDRYGHAAGDIVLRRVTGLCRNALRTSDVIGRLGGEEFAVVLPETSLRGAQETAERLRSVIAGTVIKTPAASISVTASFGISTLHGGETKADPALRRADAALFQAKREGRDRIVCNSDTELPDVA